ncbi:MAG TPA: hypothetical protein VGQ36_06135 [Thermoanaerobaculia bacterium]|jgi:hypothetical protein|nr:hypothetical protein [Thermoanaerobaculia bacterium]
MSFRDRLVASLKAAEAVLDVPGVMVAGSQVPNLLQPDASSTLVVSDDVDIVIPVSVHAEVKQRLTGLRGYAPAPDEPSVWLPDDPEKLEINFIGADPAARESADSYVLNDDQLPLLVFGLLSFLRQGPDLVLADLRVPLPRPAGLLLEKLLTERSGLKGERDLLVALGLLLVSGNEAIDELASEIGRLRDDQRRTVTANLALLSLLRPLPGMPDPTESRQILASLIRRLESLR